MSRLFSPITLGNQTLANRIVVAPMCQYSANDGCASDWHWQHWAQLAMSGAGLVVVEATAVERRGRISPRCLGLYSDANVAAMDAALRSARRLGVPQTRFAIQLAHAGRKASCQVPWLGGQPLSAAEDAWPVVGPSALAFSDSSPVPEALGEAGLERVQTAFVEAARRSVELGFEAIELHCAHGYLLHEFLSPIANRRTDQYGGSLDNRMRFPLAVARAVRAATPASVALGARITGTDWREGGIDEAEAVAFASALKSGGFDYLCVSSGAIAPKIKIPVGPGYQVALATRVKQAAGIATRSVGMIVNPQQAELIVASGQSDMVALARAFLDDPRWPWHAAEALGAEIEVPPQYRLGYAKYWPGAQLARPHAGSAL